MEIYSNKNINDTIQMEDQALQNYTIQVKSILNTLYKKLSTTSKCREILQIKIIY